MPGTKLTQDNEPTDPRGFEGTWNVVAGNPVGRDFTDDKYDMRIQWISGDDTYKLYCTEWENRRGVGESREAFIQNLKYCEDTQTLEDLGPKDPERCISLWNRHARRGNQKRSIFAMRVGEVASIAPHDLPALEQGACGSWGAEDEGG